MKVNLFENPPPLWIGEGEDRFALMLRPCTEADRMHILDALSIGLAALQAAVDRLVIGWQNVIDPAGNPVPFEAMELGGRKVCNLGRFLGAVPLATQIAAMTAIVGFVGLPTESLKVTVGPGQQVGLARRIRRLNEHFQDVHRPVGQPLAKDEALILREAVYPLQKPLRHVVPLDQQHRRPPAGDGRRRHRCCSTRHGDFAGGEGVGHAANCVREKLSAVSFQPSAIDYQL